MNFAEVRSIVNERAIRAPYPAKLRGIMSMERAREIRAWLLEWSELARGPTPLVSLPDLASRLGVAEISVKDESVRSPLGSFKALGAPCALVQLIQRLHSHRVMSPEDLLRGRLRTGLGEFTVISATDGNHGRCLAAAASSIGCNCVIVLHANVSREREDAIMLHHARIVRIEGNYDQSVEEAARLAAGMDWQVVSDTSYEGYEEVPRDVMQGYGIIAAEVLESTGSKPGERGRFTHVFIQGGVGGVAAGLGSYLWEFHGANRPGIVIIEPMQADCLFQSARLGRPARATGTVDSVMAGLACGEASALAWRFLQPLVDGFAVVPDHLAVHAMQLLARGSRRDMPLISGESGAAGLAGLIALLDDEAAARRTGLDGDSRILLINTEGATAPGVYEHLVGERVESVCVRQADWVQSARAAARYEACKPERDSSSSR